MKKEQDLNLRPILIILIIVAFIIGAVGGVFGSFFLKPYLEKTEWGREFLGPEKLTEKEFESNEQIIQVTEDSSTINAVEKVAPAVVSIVVSKELENIYNLTGPGLEEFFGFDLEWENMQRQAPRKQEIGGGTGFIIDESGLILTNRHVVEDELAEYSVILNDGTKYEAEVLARDMIEDIAILKIEAENLTVAELGNSNDLKIGQTVIAIGNALTEYQNTVTKGVISGIDRKIVAGGSMSGAEVIDGALQTDAAINPGNSGGPLLNLAGQVIGINTAINWEGRALGFAIPIDQAKKVINSVKEFGKIVRPWLGIRYIQLNEQIAEKNNLKYDYGALILRGSTETDLAVIPGSPADQAGLTENDIILAINGQELKEGQSLLTEIAKYNPDEEIEIKYFHKDEEKTVKVKLVERPEGY